MNLLSVIIENKKRPQLYKDYYIDIKLLYSEVLSDWKDIITQPKYTKDMPLEDEDILLKTLIVIDYVKPDDVENFIGKKY